MEAVGKLIHLREKGQLLECITAASKWLDRRRGISARFRNSLLGIRSDCYLDTEQWQKAIVDLTSLLHHAPEGAVYANRGLARWYGGNLDSALDDFRKALSFNRFDAVTLRNIGRLQMERRKVRSGLLYLRRAIAASPNDSLGHVFLGDALAKTGDWVRACEAYLAALKLDPSNTRALQQVAKVEQFLREEV
jgi:tetratricopeptide (TPR) repeat protein